MKTVLVVYDSRSGHTARIARRIWETIIAEGHQADMMHVLEADREGVDWNKYDLYAYDPLSLEPKHSQGSRKTNRLP